MLDGSGAEIAARLDRFDADADAEVAEGSG
jgi:hypothetical protein